MPTRIQIFNRARTRKHRLYEALNPASATAGDAEVCKKANLRHDPRVSERRERQLLSHLRVASPGPDTILDQVGVFTQDTVTSAAAPGFLRSRNNRVRFRGSSPEFCTVINVNGLARVFLWACLQWEAIYHTQPPSEVTEAFERFKDFPKDEPLDWDKVSQFVELQMANPEGFLEHVGIVHRFRSASIPYHPVWLTRTSDLCAAVPGEDPAWRGVRWIHRVGVSVEKKEGQMLCLVRFPSPGPLFYPSVLDGTTEYFCPAPEGYPMESGVALDLNSSSPDCAQEFIAPWPDMRTAVYIDSVNVPAAASSTKCTDVRKDHWKKLDGTSSLPVASKEWLDRVRADS